MSSSSSAPVKVLIAAAGSGVRCGGDISKQYQGVAGKSVLRHTLEKFLQIPEIDEIRVIINPKDADLYHEAVQGLGLGNFIDGSNARKNSVYNGLGYFSNVNFKGKILIHDAARPFVAASDIRRVIEALDTHKAVTLAKPVKDTLKTEDNRLVDRNGLWAIETPQGFDFQTIWGAHASLRERDDFTDDTSLITELGGEVHLLQSHHYNGKITTQDDLEMAGYLLSNAYEIRTGQGFDVHAFDDGQAEYLRLCGIDVPHDRKLKGHSDADVALHALTDAILGAIGKGDIGLHFPPSDDEWKGKDSAYFMQEAMMLVKQKSAELVNIDLTIICEEPKIGPYRDEMMRRLQELLEIDISRINIKATTTEQLGFTGRKEGIAAQAIANVRLPV